mmetsp:Transcript_65076/g.209717  ORF Transcript_65076/g.209717 Transcript_65076/m.209717 type:complete len:238 (+) Transcript_65076:1108-1821(+)
MPRPQPRAHWTMSLPIKRSSITTEVLGPPISLKRSKFRTSEQTSRIVPSMGHWLPRSSTSICMTKASASSLSAVGRGVRMIVEQVSTATCLSAVTSCRTPLLTTTLQPYSSRFAARMASSTSGLACSARMAIMQLSLRRALQRSWRRIRVSGMKPTMTMCLLSITAERPSLKFSRYWLKESCISVSTRAKIRRPPRLTRAPMAAPSVVSSALPPSGATSQTKIFQSAGPARSSSSMQ